MISLPNHYLLRGGNLLNSMLTNAGSYDFYWASTPNGSSFAYYLYFRSGYIAMTGDSRYLGLSVRCVAAG